MLLLVLSALAAAIWCAAAPAAPPRLAHVGRDGVAFRYPATWRRYSWREDSMFSHGIVSLGTAVERNPCTTSAVPGGTSIACGLPLKRLEPGGVLVSWVSFGRPGWELGAEPGAARRVGGRAARVQDGPATGACAQIGGDVEITAHVASPQIGDGYALDACLRRPRLAAARRQVRALLESTTFSGP